MLLAVQIPIADARAFLDSEAGRLALPGWPSPQVDVEFVRSVGSVRERRRGGLAPWVGEGHYADARRTLRFPSEFGARETRSFGEPARMTCVFRRFFSDGRAVARCEAGFVPRAHRRTKRVALDAQEVLGLITSCLSLPAEIRQPNRSVASSELVEAGRHLARQFLSVTTKRPFAVPLEPWWVRALRPIVVMTYAADSVVAVPRSARSVHLGIGCAAVVHHLVVARGGITVPVWMVSFEDLQDEDLVRRVRLHLFRLHAEREVLKWTFSLIAQRRLAVGAPGVNGDALQRYLNDALTIVKRGAIYGVGPSDDLRSALGLQDLVNTGERETLLAQLHAIRGNVFRKVAAAEHEQRSRPIVFADTYNEIKGAMVVEDKSTNIGDITGSDIHGVIGSGNTITDSFKQIDSSAANDELKAALKDLLAAVQQAQASVADDAMRQQLDRDAAGLVTEATSEAPRRGMIEALGEGIVQVAKTVGEVGLPVIKLVTQIVALFG